MAKNINAGEVTRGDLFLIPPEEIIIPERNARRFPVQEDSSDIIEDALDVVDRGILEPLEVRRVEEDKVELVFGHRRLLILKYINEQKLHPAGPMKAPCIVVTIDEKEAFLHRISENRKRKSTTLMDDAYNARTLIDDYGMTQREVAKQFGRGDAWISQILKLNTLPVSYQKKINNGKLSADAAIELAKIEDPEERDKLMEEIEANDGRVTKEKVVEKARKKRGAAGARMRSAKTIRACMEKVVVEGDFAGSGTEALASEIIKYIDGDISDRQMTSRMEKYCKARV